MSIRSIRGSRIRWSASGWQGFSSRDWIGSSATCCPSPARGDASRWQTGPWFLRSERCYLIPGDSPIGYRLPLDSQPWAAKGDYPFIHRPIRRASFSALLPHAEIRRQIRERASARAALARGAAAGCRRNPPPISRAPRCAPRPATACCTSSCRRRANSNTTWNWWPRSKPRRKRSRSPSSSRATSRLAIRGIGHFRVTPDPGVIEVNIHPSATWDELVDRTTFLYEAARECAFDHREIHAGRPAHRHRRRQSHGARRRDAGGFAVSAPPRFAAQLAGLLAQPSVVVISVFRIVHRTHFAGAARRRSAQRFPVRAGNRVPPVSKTRREHCRRGWWIGCCAIC